MSLTAIALILIAAVAHASWNLFSKQASATGAVFFTWLMATLAAVIYAPVVAVAVIVTRPHLTGVNWLFMVGTGVLETGYFLFLQTGYRLGDLSVVYPIGRGTGALLAALAGIVLLGERPGIVALAGIGCIVAGIIAIGLPARPAGNPGPARLTAAPPAAPPTLSAPAAPPARPVPPAGPVPPASTVPPADPVPPASTVPAARAGTRPAPALAVAVAIGTGMFIASYTLWDKHAVSALRTPALLQGYASFPVMLAALAPIVLRDRPRLGRAWRSFRTQAVGAAVLSPLAYILVLAALSFTAVSAVAPAREVSVLFGVLLGRRLLNEGSLRRRLVAAVAIVAGIVAVAIA